MMRALILTTAILVLGAATAHAQPGMTPVVPVMPLQQPAQPAAEDPTPSNTVDYKSPATATMLSIGGTVLPVVALAAMTADDRTPSVGLAGTVAMIGFFGPSFGHWYSGDYVTPGLGLRAGGTVLAIVGFGEAFSCAWSDTSCTNGMSPLILGLGLYAGGTILDIATAGSSAKRWNTHHVRLVPTAITSAGHTSMGAGLSASF